MALDRAQEIIDAARLYGQRRLAEIQPHGYPVWMDEPRRRVLRTNSYALFVALSLNGQIRADDAWNAPQLLVDRGLQLDPSWIAANEKRVYEAVARPPVIHRYKVAAAECIVRGARRILKLYDGQAAKIWQGNPLAAEVVRRFDEFYWIGPEKAAFATGFLAESLGVPMRDLDQLNVKVDVHVRRVALRTGLSASGDAVSVREAVRAGYPENPFAVDRGLWFVGAEFCHATRPECPRCPLDACCPKRIAGSVAQGDDDRSTAPGRRLEARGASDGAQSGAPAPHDRPTGRPGRTARPATQPDPSTPSPRASPAGKTRIEVYNPRSRRARLDAGLTGGYARSQHNFTIGDRVQLNQGRYRGVGFSIRAIDPDDPVAPITLWRASPYASGNRKYLAVFPEEIEPVG